MGERKGERGRRGQFRKVDRRIGGHDAHALSRLVVCPAAIPEVALQVGGAPVRRTTVVSQIRSPERRAPGLRTATKRVDLRENPSSCRYWGERKRAGSPCASPPTEVARLSGRDALRVDGDEESSSRRGVRQSIARPLVGDGNAAREPSGLSGGDGDEKGGEGEEGAQVRS